MKESVQLSFHQYELGQLFKVYKLLSNNFYRDAETVRVIEDAVKIRVSEPE